MKFFKKLIAALTATSLVTVSGFSSVCMAAREKNFDLKEAYQKYERHRNYSLELLNSIDKSIGLAKSDDDGNYLKKGNLSDEERKIYDEIVKQVEKVKDSASKDTCDLSEDYKLAKAIFFWVRNNINYDTNSRDIPVEMGSLEYKLDLPAENSEKRKPQDALTVFNNREGVCEGNANLVQLMMKIAGLPCICVANNGQAFNAVWLGENSGGWALFDTTAETKKKKEQEWLFENATDESGKSIKEIYKNSIDNLILDEKFPAVYNGKNSNLEESNKSFINPFKGNHFVYIVYDNLTGMYKTSLKNHDGVDYILVPRALLVGIDSKSKADLSVVVDEEMLQYVPKCMLFGRIENIKNFDVFYKNFVKVDISGSHFNKTIKQDGLEFNLSADGKKSKLEIKPSDGGKNFDTVTVPNELIPFLPDIDEFKVDSNIKTVKYDFLWKEQAFKENVILPKDVKFEQIDLIK